jgi:hypothetical protein
LDDEAADDGGVDLDRDVDLAAPRDIRKRAAQCLDMLGLQRLGDGHNRPRDAFSRIVQQIEVADHVKDREEPAFRRDELEEFGSDPADFRLREKGIERLHLLLGGKHRAFDETLQIRARSGQFREAGKTGRSAFRRPGLLTEREERLGIAPRHPGHACLLRCQSEIPKFETPAKPLPEDSSFHGEKSRGPL